MRWIFFATLLFSFRANAQWLNAAYTFSDVTYKEGSTITQKGRLAGVKGELGLPLMAGISISGFGEYQSGMMNYDGTTLGGGTLTGITKDYFRDLRGLVNFHFGGLTLAGGLGQRYWYNDLVTSYRQRQQYDYTPITATFRHKYMYLRAEAYLWREGKNTTYMSDLGAAREPISFKQKNGMGYAGEIGMMIPNAMGFATHVFVAYQKWEVKSSDTVFDGVDYLTIPENNTTSLQLGVGVSF